MVQPLLNTTTAGLQLSADTQLCNFVILVNYQRARPCRFGGKIQDDIWACNLCNRKAHLYAIPQYTSRKLSQCFSLQRVQALVFSNLQPPLLLMYGLLANPNLSKSFMTYLRVTHNENIPAPRTVRSSPNYFSHAFDDSIFTESSYIYTSAN